MEGIHVSFSFMESEFTEDLRSAGVHQKMRVISATR